MPNQTTKFSLPKLSLLVYLKKSRKLLSKVGYVLWFTSRSFSDARGAEAAASITFYAVFSLFPLLLILVSIGSLYLKSEQIQASIIELAKLITPLSSEIILNNINQILAQHKTMGAIGIISLIWSASGYFSILSRNIERALPVIRNRHYLESRLIAFGMITILVMILFSFSFTTPILHWLSSLNHFVSNDFIIFQSITWIIFTNLLPIFVRFIIFFSLYHWVPNKKVRWSTSFWAAFFATLAWEVTTRAFIWYLRSGIDNYQLVYGSLGAMVAFMFWVYLSNVIILFCAYLSAAIHNSANI